MVQRECIDSAAQENHRVEWCNRDVRTSTCQSRFASPFRCPTPPRLGSAACTSTHPHLHPSSHPLRPRKIPRTFIVVPLFLLLSSFFLSLCSLLLHVVLAKMARSSSRVELLLVNLTGLQNFSLLTVLVAFLLCLAPHMYAVSLTRGHFKFDAPRSVSEAVRHSTAKRGGREE